jgi:hypothetical protein
MNFTRCNYNHINISSSCTLNAKKQYLTTKLSIDLMGNFMGEIMNPLFVICVVAMNIGKRELSKK